MKKIYNVGDIVTVKSATQLKVEGELLNYCNGVYEDNTSAEIVNYNKFTSKASGLLEDKYEEPLYIIKFQSRFGTIEYRRIIQSHIIEHKEKN